MKKNSLTTAVLASVAGVAGLAGVAHAVNLNPDGLGQVLVYPYYTVNGGNSTVISVVNTTNTVKAVKVRFVEALNSAEVYDFNLYLSPYDVWATNVVADGTTGAKLITVDKSCTVPNVLPGAFLPWEYMNNTPDVLRQFWTTDDSLKRVRQGHLEVIEMGVVTADAIVDDGTNTGRTTTLALAATHVNGVPRNCELLETAWNTGGAWVNNRNYGVRPPEGGLFGGATIISGEYGRTLSYNAEAIDGFYRTAGSASLHYNPGTVLPNLAQASTAAGEAEARIFSNGDFYRISYLPGIDAVSAVFTARYIYNEYNVNAELDAASEWVITFPTKRYHVRNTSAPYSYAGVAQLPFQNAFPIAYDEFTSDFGPSFAGSCHNYRFDYWDREERQIQRPLTVSPPAPGPAAFRLCWEANVLAFGQTINAATPTRILGATSRFGGSGLSGFEYPEGWARLELDNPNSAGFNYYLPRSIVPAAGGTADQVLVGQPVTGFWASEVVNNSVEAGVRANYGVVHKHRVSRDCRIHSSAGAIQDTAGRCPAL